MKHLFSLVPPAAPFFNFHTVPVWLLNAFLAFIVTILFFPSFLAFTASFSSRSLSSPRLFQFAADVQSSSWHRSHPSLFFWNGQTDRCVYLWSPNAVWFCLPRARRQPADFVWRTEPLHVTAAKLYILPHLSGSTRGNKTAKCALFFCQRVREAAAAACRILAVKQLFK